MALTYSPNYEGVVGAQKVWQGTITFDSSYPEGGEAFSPSDIGFVEFDMVLVSQASSGDTGDVLPFWDKDTGNLRLNALVDGNEVASLSDQSAVVVNVVAYGK